MVPLSPFSEVGTWDFPEGLAQGYMQTKPVGLELHLAAPPLSFLGLGRGPTCFPELGEGAFWNQY